MRQLTINERRAGWITGTIIVIRRELKKDRRRWLFQRLRQRLRHGLRALEDTIVLIGILSPVVAAWVIIMDQLLKAKGL